VFSGLSAPTIVVGTAAVTLSGFLLSGPVAPAGSLVAVTLNGVTQAAGVGADGSFSVLFGATGAVPLGLGLGPSFAGFDVSTLPAGAYAISYSFAGAGVFQPAHGSGTLTVTYTVALVGSLTPSFVLGGTFGGELFLSLAVSDAAGNNVGSDGLAVTAVGLAPASNPSAIQPAPPAGGLNPGNQLQFAAGLYVYALDTTAVAPGDYLFYFTVQGDPVQHAVLIQVL
jgi:hypothetical protein